MKNVNKMIFRKSHMFDYNFYNQITIDGDNVKYEVCNKLNGINVIDYDGLISETQFRLIPILLRICKEEGYVLVL